MGNTGEMTGTTPRILVEMLKETASLLRRSFERVGSLNGRRDAPMPERNTVVHLGASFLERGFAVCSEPSFFRDEGRRSRRLDLLASNGRETFLVEVKTFGQRDFSRVLDDARRIVQFRPNPAERIDRKEVEFWEASSRWGCVVIQSFTEELVNELWRKQVGSPLEFEEELQNGRFTRLKPEEKPGFRNLAEFLRSVRADVGSTLVCERDKIWKCAALNLLWAAFPLSPREAG